RRLLHVSNALDDIERRLDEACVLNFVPSSRIVDIRLGLSALIDKLLRRQGLEGRQTVAAPDHEQHQADNDSQQNLLDVKQKECLHLFLVQADFGLLHSSTSCNCPLCNLNRPCLPPCFLLSEVGPRTAANYCPPAGTAAGVTAGAGVVCADAS